MSDILDNLQTNNNSLFFDVKGGPPIDGYLSPKQAAQLMLEMAQQELADIWYATKEVEPETSKCMDRILRMLEGCKQCMEQY